MESLKLKFFCLLILNFIIYRIMYEQGCRYCKNASLQIFMYSLSISNAHGTDPRGGKSSRKILGGGIFSEKVVIFQGGGGLPKKKFLGQVSQNFFVQAKKKRSSFSKNLLYFPKILPWSPLSVFFQTSKFSKSQKSIRVPLCIFLGQVSINFLNKKKKRKKSSTVFKMLIFQGGSDLVHFLGGGGIYPIPPPWVLLLSIMVKFHLRCAFSNQELSQHLKL